MATKNPTPRILVDTHDDYPIGLMKSKIT